METPADPAPLPFATRLGHDPAARLVVVHVDDLGMCHAANVGGFEALDAGPASCGSLMVPCPWFPEAAAMAADRPDVDLGVHLTLNAEWAAYRWGPVAGAGRAPSLCAADGAMYRTLPEVLEHARPEEVELELRAQIDRALDAGIDVTHIDAHMGTAFAGPFVEIYARLMRDYRLPAFVARPDVESLPPALRTEALDRLLELVDGLAADGFPIFDHFDADSLTFDDAPGAGETHNLGRLSRMANGLNYLIIHAAQASAELDAVGLSKPHCRDFERRFYGGDEGRDAIEREGLQVIGMREIRDAMRAAMDAARS